MSTQTTRGYTVREISQRYRVSPERVRKWIESGQLRAINRREPGKRQSFVVLLEALTAFEQTREVAPTSPPNRQQRRKKTSQVDYYPG
jgi:uncharacterized protein YjcR